MISVQRLLFLTFCMVMTLSSVGLMAQGNQPADQKPYWKISGELEEACKCNAACPCWFGAKPTNMNCGGQLVYFITKGEYGNVNLDGLAFARTGQSPDGKAMAETSGHWIFDNLYIDEKANAEQRKALESIAWMTEHKESSKVQVRYVPITRTIDGKIHHVKIGQYGTFSAHLLDSFLGGAPKITHAPGADPIRAEFLQGVTVAFKFNDAAQNWNTQGSNYMFTKFSVDSKQYEEFGKTMMQKMQAMKSADSSPGEH